MKTPVGVSIWFGTAPPHSATLDLLFRSTTETAKREGDRKVHVRSHAHSTVRRSLVELRAFRDEKTGLDGADVLDVFERLVRQMAE